MSSERIYKITFNIECEVEAKNKSQAINTFWDVYANEKLTNIDGEIKVKKIVL